MNQSQLKLRRRMFLGAMGLGLSAPLAFRMSRMAVAQAAPRPRRLLIVYIPHGMPDEHFMPAGADGALDLLPSPLGVLAPLEPYKSHLTVLRGISMNAGATNHAAIRATLTGFPEGAGSDSIDSLIAGSLGVPSYALGTVPYSQGAGFYQDCFLLKQGTWVRPEADPAKSAATLFASLDNAPKPAVDESVFRNEVMALTEGEVAAVHSTLAGLTSEQNKLQVHLDAVRTLKAQLASTKPVVTSCLGRPTLPAVDAARGLNPLDTANFAKLLDANLEIIGRAFQCGTAKVMTLQNMYVNAQINMGFAGGPGIAKEHHDPISHSWDTAGRADFATVQRWFYEKIATKLVKYLAETDDFADSTPRKLIDNTLICVCSEISDGANHNSDASDVWVNGKAMPTSLPIVLIGGGSGYLAQKTGGRIVDVKRMHTDVLATLADAMGVPLTKIGAQAVKPIIEVTV